jgi:catechol 2,3-dioxygenase-like lactoylglutathione lyase family enzyme
MTTTTSLLRDALPIAKLPAQDLDRARDWYREKLGLEPVEQRPGGYRYVCAGVEFHVFKTTGAPSGTHTQMGFEVEDLDAVMAELKARGVEFEADTGLAGGHYPSKGRDEVGTWFMDSEGNLMGLGQAVR